MSADSGGTEMKVKPPLVVLSDSIFGHARRLLGVVWFGIFVRENISR